MSRAFKLSNKVTRNQAEILLCEQDLYHHLENHFHIVDKEGKLRLMNPLKQAQKKLVSLILMCRKMGIPARIIVLKARKEGLSTVVQALGYLTARDEGKTVLVIAHDIKTSNEIFAISTRFHRNYDLPKPPIPTPNRREMRFSSREGQIMVDTANNVQAGTGLTPHFLHGSEVAKWQRGAETSIALFQAIGDSKETTVILESTAQGYDSLFHPIWKNAEEHCTIDWNVNSRGEFEPAIHVQDKLTWNGYIPLFISWFEDPDYQKTFDTEDDKHRFAGILDDYEKMLIDRFDVSLEQLLWRRYILVHKCNHDIRVFKQEYPSLPKEAFVVSGRTRFNLEKLDLMPVVEPLKGFLTEQDKFNRAIRFVKDSGGIVQIYSKPIRGHRYILIIDPAEGKQPEGATDPDETVLHVYDLDDPEGMKQVAVIADLVPEDEMVEPAKMLGAWYNLAFMVPLVTGGYGTHITSEILKEYPNDRVIRIGTNVGLKEHVGNRTDMISHLAAAIERDEIIFQDENTVEQLRHFKRSRSGKLEAESGWHDDHVSVAYGAVKGASLYPASLRPVNSAMVPWRESVYSTFKRQRRRDSQMDNTGGYSAC